MQEGAIKRSLQPENASNQTKASSGRSVTTRYISISLRALRTQRTLLENLPAMQSDCSPDTGVVCLCDPFKGREVCQSQADLREDEFKAQLVSISLQYQHNTLLLSIPYDWVCELTVTRSACLIKYLQEYKKCLKDNKCNRDETPYPGNVRRCLSPAPVF
jgi:hypothetical protein